MTWNGSYSFDASIFGYPNNKSNPDGRYSMWACLGKTFEDGGSASINGCDFGKGSSGGLWLDEYSNASGLGYVRSISSTWEPSTGETGDHISRMT